MDHPRSTPLRGGGRFVVEAIETSPPRIVKSGDPVALAREARALRIIAGRDIGPELISSERGRLTTTRVPGWPRRLSELERGDAIHLGQLLRRVHEVRATRTGGLPGWSGRARSLEAYRRRRASDALAAAGRHRELARRIVDNLPPIPDGGNPANDPFGLLHGDLTARNIVWGPGPMLVDWEFWRMGDPAEDLAYLIGVNRLADASGEAILAGYAQPAVAARVSGWIPLCVLDAGLWYSASGRPDRGEPLLEHARRCTEPVTQL